MTNPPSNKLLIFNSILLVLILALLILFNFNKLKNKIVRNSDDIYEPISEDYPDKKYYPIQDSLKVDFNILNNDTFPLPTEIVGIITTELNSFNWNNAFQTEDLYSIYHETVFAKHLSLGSKARKGLVVITFSNYGGNYSHVARGRISLFEFQKQNKAWKMTRIYLACGVGTEYGMEPRWCKIVRIGNNNKYALIVQTNYSGNWGHEFETQSVYAEVGCSFNLVFDFINYEHYEDYPKDFEYTEGYSNMRFVKGNKDMFDIETKGEETEWQDKSPGAVKHFTFNGKEYIEIENLLKR